MLVKQLCALICSRSFPFFLALLFAFLPHIYINTCITPRAPITIPKFLQMTLSEHHALRDHLTECFYRVHTSENAPFSLIWGFCFLVFAFPLAYGCIRTLPNHFAPICTHLCRFLSNTPKHDVRGNFPDHSTQILV